MRVLVIGGTNFIGPEAVKQLVAMGHQVTVFHRGEHAGELPDGLTRIQGNRADLESHRATFAAFRPEVVLDMFPLGEADSQAVVEAVRGIARRTVAISSADVYRAFGRILGSEPGEPEPVPLTEESPTREKLFPYRGSEPRAEDAPDRRMDDYDKLLVERVYLGQEDLPGTVLRLPMVYGPRDQQHRFGAYLSAMDRGRPVIVLPESTATWRTTRGFVEDVGYAIALAVSSEQAAGQLYNVAEELVQSERELVAELAEATGWQGDVVVVPDDANLPPHLAGGGLGSQDLIMDASKIRRELGWRELRPRAERVAATIAWERANREERDYSEEDAAEDRFLEAWRGRGGG